MFFKNSVIFLSALLIPALLQAQNPRPSAWEAILRQDPGVVDDPSFDWRDRLILDALTPQQAQLYLSGASLEQLIRTDGQTLSEYLEARLAPAAGVFVALPSPCPLLEEETLAAAEERVYRARGDEDLWDQGGSPLGCAIAENATAVVVQFRVSPQEEFFRLKAWGANAPEPAFATFSNLGMTDAVLGERVMTTVVSLCRDCPEGDFRIASSTNAVISAQALGYFRSLRSADLPSTPSYPRLSEDPDKTAVGQGALANLTSGFNNTAVGVNALNATTSGDDNTAVGENALKLTVNGNQNTAVGTDALSSNEGGDENTALGEDALRENDGSQNTAVGEDALRLNDTGDNNTAVGEDALSNNKGGNGNTAVGEDAGTTNTTGAGNSFFGRLANATVSTLVNATAIGSRALVGQDNSLVLGSINGVNGATADVKVGIGTSVPQTPLHVQRSDGSAQIRVEEQSPATASRTLFNLRNNGAAFFSLRNTNAGSTWSFSVSGVGAFQIDNPAIGGAAEMVFFNSGAVRMGAGGMQKFLLDPAGNLTISGDLNAAGMLYPSDRNLKENVVPVNAVEVLEKLADLPIAYWSYKSDPLAVRHVGPMSQDFLKSFTVGSDERRINAMDAAGVTLAALQGLYQFVREQARELELQREEIKSLRRRVSALESSQEGR